LSGEDLAALLEWAVDEADWHGQRCASPGTLQ
jgi:hypothetical protein